MEKASQESDSESEATSPPTPSFIEERSAKRKATKRFGIGLSLAVCYSASCGGMATLSGTLTNMILFNLINARVYVY